MLFMYQFAEACLVSSARRSRCILSVCMIAAHSPIVSIPSFLWHVDFDSLPSSVQLYGVRSLFGLARLFCFTSCVMY